MSSQFLEAVGRVWTLFVCCPVIFLLASPVACGEGGDATDSADDEGTSLVIGASNIFATPNITAASGATITVVNNDDTPHTVTSQSAEGAFDDTGDFDVIVSSSGTGLLTLPDAPSGTVFFYYCRFHTSAMSPTGGTITIE